MNQEMPASVARLTMITLGVSNMRASIAFYEALGFTRKFRATGETVAFFETGGTAIGLFPWDQLAQDVTLPDHPRPQAFRGVTLAWNCRTMDEVDAVLNFAVAKGASLLKPAHETDYGGYSGYFADPDGHPWEAVVAPGIEWAKTGAFICRIEPALSFV
jgi:catechol 2,3-dioxygenase-like lactoylglutathione lyase family enzyme